MTTIAIDLKAMKIATDTQNTDSAGTAYRCRKVERLKNGSIFVGSGHLLSIGKAKRWAEKGFAEKDRPEWGELFGKYSDNFLFSCVVIAPDGAVTLIDDEMEPQPVFDKHLALGTGGAFAVAAMDAGASVEDAVKIACKRDIYSSEPIEVFSIPVFKSAK